MRKLTCMLAIMIMSAGCGTTVDIGKFVDETQALVEWYQSMPDILSPPRDFSDDEQAFTDALDLSAVVWHGPDVSGWEVTHDLRFEGKFGGQVRLIQDATKEWPTDYDVVGTCWLFIQDSENRWHAHQWDYIRPGQTLRHFPWNPPHPEDGKNYATVKAADPFAVMVSGLCRDKRRNVSKRTRVVRVM